MKVFWELSRGTAQATKGSKEAVWYVGNPVDIAINATLDVLNLTSMALVISIIWEGLIPVLWLGPPVVAKQQGELGNALSPVACRLFKIAAQAGSRAIMEQPTTSWMWCCQDFLETHSDVKGWFGNRDVCLDGAPWRNPTSFYPNEKAIQTISGKCDCTVKHLALAGKCGSTNERWADLAGPYWPGIVKTLEKPFRESSAQMKTANTVHRIGCLTNDGKTVLENE